jgi:hypothetical protein
MLFKRTLRYKPIVDLLRFPSSLHRPFSKMSLVPSMRGSDTPDAGMTPRFDSAKPAISALFAPLRKARTVIFIQSTCLNRSDCLRCCSIFFIHPLVREIIGNAVHNSVDIAVSETLGYSLEKIIYFQLVQHLLKSLLPCVLPFRSENPGDVVILLVGWTVSIGRHQASFFQCFLYIRKASNTSVASTSRDPHTSRLLS